MSMTRTRRLTLMLIPAFAVSVVAGGLLTAQPAPADAYLSESFTGSTLTEASNWSTANASGTAVCLTGLNSSATAIPLADATVLPGCSTSPSAAGSGALRLVKAVMGQSGSIFYKEAQSTTYGLDISFTMSMVGSSSPGVTGNGMAFFLKDGVNAADIAGPGGAPLGYARLGESSETQPGVPGGLLGVGFDVYGGYGDSTYFAQNGCAAGKVGVAAALQPNMVGVRGPDTSTSSPKNGAAGYCWIAGTTSPGTLFGGDPAAAARQVRIVVDPSTATTPKVSVYVGPAGGGAVPTSPTLQFDQPDELKAATSFKFGFSASTGAAVLDAYVSNILIKKANTQVLYVVPSGYTYTYGTNPGTIAPTVAYQTTLGNASTNVANPASGNTGWSAPTCSASGTFNGSTSAGISTGAISCTGGSGGALYTLDTTSVANVTVSKANPTCTVTPYAASFTGAAITATGSCLGVGGATLSGLDLTGTTHTVIGTYATDAWSFTDVTGNYNNTAGTVSNSISAAPTFTVSYVGNGATSGSVPVDSTAYVSSGTVTVLGNTGSLTLAGSTFAGWTTDAAGSGTVYSAGSSYVLSATSVVFYAKWTAALQGTTATPVAAAPAAAPAAVGSLDPILNGVNGNVSAGQSLLLDNGVPLQVQVAPNEQSAPTGLVASGDGFWMRLSGRSGNGDPLRLGVQAQLILQSIQSGARSGPTASSVACVVGRPTAESSGTGFKPGSQVKLYLLPSTELGSITVGSDGSYSGSVPVPAGLALGTQTLQANGLRPSGAVRSLSLGVQVVPARVAVSRQATRRVLFNSMSPVISAQGRKALNALARQAGTSGKRTVVVGFVNRNSPSSDRSLSTKRARAVAKYLKSRGVTGSYQVRVDRISGKGNRALRVNVTVTYQPGC